MRARRVARVWTAIAIAVLGLGASGDDVSAASPWFLPYAPATALSNGRVVDAWTSGGRIWTATQNANGRFGRSVAIGHSAYGSSPMLAAAPGGDLTLVWLAPEGIRSAFRSAGQRTWSPEVVRLGGSTKVVLGLVVDQTGRAIVIVAGYDGGVNIAPMLAYTHARGGTWSGSPSPIGYAYRGASIAVDSAGDAIVAYGSCGSALPCSGPTTIEATLLASGTTTWSPPVTISGPMDPSMGITDSPTVVGGGARTFIATWPTGHNSQPPATTFAARLRVPVGWEPPEPVISPAAGSLGNASNLAGAVDAEGNATMVWQYPAGSAGKALGVTSLAASDSTFSLPTTLDLPAPGDSDSPPSIATGSDGSTAIAFLLQHADGAWLRVATAQGPLGEWQGIGTDVARASSCALPSACAWEGLLAPSIAYDGRTLAVAAKTSAGIVSLTRPAPGEPVLGPALLEPSEATAAYLRSAHVRNGTVQVQATCGLPPCGATAVLRTIGATSRKLGQVRITLLGSRVGTRRIALPRWARPQLARGAELDAQLTTRFVEEDGITDTVVLNVLLHA